MTDLINNSNPNSPEGKLPGGAGELPGVPPLEELAIATINSLAGEGYTSSVMKLKRPVLNELARRLVMPGHKREDTLDWLRDSKGITEAALPNYTLDRFFQRFREKFEGVLADARNRCIIAEMAADPDFSDEDLQRYIKNKTVMLIAQEMSGASPEEIDTNRLKVVLSLIQSADHGQLERAKLALASELSDQRARKLKSELDIADERVRKLQNENEAIERKHRQALEAAKAETAALAASTDNGNESGKLSEADVLAILDRAMKGEL